MKNRYIRIVGFIIIVTIFSSFSCKKSKETPNEIIPIAASHSIIPLPKSINFAESNFTIDKNVLIVGEQSFDRAKNVIAKEVKELISLNLKQSTNSGTTNHIFLQLDNTLADTEYEININESGVTIKAKTEESMFYGAQTFRQYLWDAQRDQSKQTITMKGVAIKDAPFYNWRSFNIDVARNFFTKDYIKKLIDQMALYKMNKLHLHLTDDQGWRIPIDKYPLLIQEGSWRTLNKYDLENIERSKGNPIYTIDNRFLSQKDGQTVYQASYSKQDLRDIVAYAAENYIEVIPEIDMPGHMSAAIKAYPWLSSVGEAGWGEEFSWPICPCKPEVMQFAYDVLDEMMEIFPSEYIHIGADEVEKDTWENSEICQTFMAQNNFTHVNQIQNYFVKKVQEHVQEKGRKVIAWDDVSEGQIDDKILLMYWRDWISPNKAIANGNRFIMTPWTWFYLSGSHTDETLTTLYQFDPRERFGNNILSFIDGYQACIWTENIPSEAAFEYYVYPRFQAFSEFAWSNDRRDWDSFKRRLQVQFQYMDKIGIRYRRPTF